MAIPDFTAGSVINTSAALMNDAAKTRYTFAAQLPYLNMALQELQEYFEQNNVPVTDTVSVSIPVDAGVDHIAFETSGDTRLPDDLIEPKLLWERPRNNDPYTPMKRMDFLPRTESGVEINQFLIYTWQSQQIRVLAANQDNDIKMDYTRFLFAEITDEDDLIVVLNSKTFLEYRTAALCAHFMAENKTRADELNTFAGLALDRVVSIGTKGRQGINIRRRPFRAAFKSRSYI